MKKSPEVVEAGTLATVNGKDGHTAANGNGSKPKRLEDMLTPDKFKLPEGMSLDEVIGDVRAAAGKDLRNIFSISDILSIAGYIAPTKKRMEDAQALATLGLNGSATASAEKVRPAIRCEPPDALVDSVDMMIDPDQSSEAKILVDEILMILRNAEDKRQAKGKLGELFRGYDFGSSEDTLSAPDAADAIASLQPLYAKQRAKIPAAKKILASATKEQKPAEGIYTTEDGFSYYIIGRYTDGRYMVLEAGRPDKLADADGNNPLNPNVLLMTIEGNLQSAFNVPQYRPILEQRGVRISMANGTVDLPHNGTDPKKPDEKIWTLKIDPETAEILEFVGVRNAGDPQKTQDSDPKQPPNGPSARPGPVTVPVEAGDAMLRAQYERAGQGATPAEIAESNRTAWRALKAETAAAPIKKNPAPKPAPTGVRTFLWNKWEAFTNFVSRKNGKSVAVQGA